MSFRRPAFALATILILLGVALFLGTAVITISTLESKIAVSQREGIDAYYVAEAGVDDALWRIKTNDSSCGGSGCASQLQAGTLNYTYTASNAPQTGQSFTVQMLSTTGQPAGNATVTVTGSVTVSGFTAQREVVSTVYLGTSSPSSGTSAVFSSGSFTVNTSGPTIVISGGNVYGTQGINLNNAKLNIGSNCIQSQSNYTNNGSTITTGGGSACIQASNYLPLPSVVSIPGFSFSYYATNNNASYNESGANTFEAAITQKLSSCRCSTATFAGPVTYVNGNFSPNSSTLSNITLNITGMLVINGSLNLNSGLGTFQWNFTDPGSGQSGLFINGAANFNDGNFNDNGILYSSSNIDFNSPKTFSVNGAMLAAGSIAIDSGTSVNLTYNATRVTNSFSQGTPTILQVKHWEEEY